MIDNLLHFIAPHYCISCGDVGGLLCESCKYDIASDAPSGCLLCGRLTGEDGVCSGCRAFVERAWYVGERSGSLEELIDRYKFERARAAHKPLGDLLLSRLPVLPKNTVVVPIPTLRSHVRQRGYDHSLLLAEHVARYLGLHTERVLRRVTSDVQRGVNKKQRFRQARQAYEVDVALRDDIPYLLVDDVVTTGATLSSAATVLRKAGASMVWAAAIARQPLENSGQ